MKTYDHTPNSFKFIDPGTGEECQVLYPSAKQPIPKSELIAERVKNALVISCCIIALIVVFVFAAGYGAELIMAIL